MNKFKAGDKVRCISGGIDLTIGKIYEVIRVDFNGLYLVDDSRDEHWRWYSKFELVKESPKTKLEEYLEII